MYVTRAQECENKEVCIPGRPDFASIFNTVSANCPNKAVQVFACGPAPLVNSCWDNTNKQNLAGKRFDFHHETFEF